MSYFEQAYLSKWVHADECSLTLRQADQARIDFAIIETELEAIHAQLARLPTRQEIARNTLIAMLGTAVLTLVGIEAFYRWLPG
jgi:outer membrane protein TolC